MTPEHIIKHYGSVIAAARAVGVTRRTVYDWIELGAVPWQWQCAYQVATDGKLKAEERTND